MKQTIKKIVAVTSIFAVTILMIGKTETFLSPVRAEDNLLIGEWTHIHDSYEANDALIAGTKVTANEEAGFTANISITGWQRNWYGVDEMPDDAWPYGDGWADNPYQLRSYTMMNVTPKSTYELSFDIENQMTSETGNPTEKNVTVTVDSGIEGDTDNTFLFTTVRIAPNGILKFDRKFTVPEDYQEDTVMIEIAYGAYAYSYGVSSSSLIKLMPKDVIRKYAFAPGTSENVNAKGILKFTSINAIQTAYEEPTVENPLDSNGGTEQESAKVVYEPCTCNHNSNVNNETPASTNTGKPNRAVIKSVKNLKGRKIQIQWKKSSGAKKYQVRVADGKKIIKKTTSKRKITFKKLSKNTLYKVSVRAYNRNGYGKWSRVKKIKVTK